MFYAISAANYEGAEQTLRMRSLIYAFVVRIWKNMFFHGSAHQISLLPVTQVKLIFFHVPCSPASCFVPTFPLNKTSFRFVSMLLHARPLSPTPGKEVVLQFM